jgi:hypothetical protein
MTIEEAETVVARCAPLEKMGKYNVLFDIKLNGFDWIYKKYGSTVRDRGIKEKKPYWYFLRSLLTTFDQREQARFTALSGISISSSIVPNQYERKLMTNDAQLLVSCHCNMASMGSDNKAMKLKRAWEVLARANPNVSCSFWTGRMIDEEYTHELAGMATFAQMMENTATPGEGGLHYLVPDITPRFFFFFSDDPVLRREQVNKHRRIIDP